MPRGPGMGGRMGRGPRGPMGRLSRFIEPALLYLLARGEGYGYDLVSKANDLGLSEGIIDPGAVYRVLRELEMQGCVASRWDTAGAGPARRLYVLTEAGYQRLRSWVEILERQANVLNEFVAECNKLLSD